MGATAQSAGVLTFEQARQTVLEYCRRIAPPAVEDVALERALGRVLAEPVMADRAFPAFPRATRDGYAVRSADLKPVPVTLRVVGQIKAGAGFDRVLVQGETVEIMTGAAVPEGADAVVMVEHTSHKSMAERIGVAGGVTEVGIERAVMAGENIVSAGAEARAGQEILSRGARLGPAQIAMAAGAGQAKVKTYLRPHVAILSTGDELVEVSKTPGPFQIRNSNSYSLAAQVTAAGGEPIRLPLAPDEPGKLAVLLQAGLAADMLLISGGVSMGKFDLVEAALQKLGAEFFFTGALIQPGRPVVFGQVGRQGLKLESKIAGSSGMKARARMRSGDSKRITSTSDNKRITSSNAISPETAGRAQPFFGLPGNPISAMVCFDLFARPVLEALGGAPPSRLPVAKARLRKELKTKTGLTRFLPAVLDGTVFEPEVEVVPWQGSGDLVALARANCYLVVPPNRDSIAAGEMVSVVLR